MSTSTYIPSSGPRFGPGRWRMRNGMTVLLRESDFNKSGEYRFVPASSLKWDFDLVNPADDETAARYGWTKEE